MGEQVGERVPSDTVGGMTTTSTDEQDLDPLTPFRDSVLTNIVALLDSATEHVSYPVTLVVGGAVVSGYVISAADYAEQLSESSGFETFLKPFTDDMSSRRGADLTDDTIDLTKFIHLKDAFIVVGSGPIKVGLWRGNLAQIDGWSVGILAIGSGAE
jgi:hypothetical protein